MLNKAFYEVHFEVSKMYILPVVNVYTKKRRKSSLESFASIFFVTHMISQYNFSRV